jgi:hypothetical protein
MNKLALFSGMLAGMFVFSTSLTVQARESSGADSWNVDAALYLWGAGIGGKTVTDDDIDVSFNDIIDNLQMAFMGTLNARKGKWSLLADIMYLDVGADKSTTANIIGYPVTVDVEIGLKSWILTGAGAYSIMQTDSTRLDLLGGARYLWMDADLDFQIGPIKESYSDSGDGLDAIVGLRGKTDLSDKWYLNYHADIGAGNSKLTWQLLAGFNYRFKHVDGAFGYRYLKWDFDDDDTFDDLDISGPYAGIRFSF